MRIERLRRETASGGVRVVADVVFEEARRPPMAVFFEVDESTSDALSLSTAPFLVGLLPAASWGGERRVLVEGPTCAVLASNLRDHVRVLAHWYSRCRETRIEARGGLEAFYPTTPKRAALLFSGGVDALASLRQNRLDAPARHPASIKDGIFVFGVSARHAPEGKVDALRWRGHLAHLERLQAFGRTTDLEVISLRTNLLHAYEGWESWRDAGFGAGMAAVGHALQARVTNLMFGSTGGGAFIPPHGSHPLLDDHLSSGAVRVLSGLPYRSRKEKVALLATWPEALDILHPCLVPADLAPETLNCGACEKCVRTMLDLEACGALEHTGAFRGHELRVEAVRAIRNADAIDLYYDEQLARDLDRKGRGDLAQAVRHAVDRLRLTPWQRRVRKLGTSIRKRLPIGPRPPERC